MNTFSAWFPLIIGSAIKSTVVIAVAGLVVWMLRKHSAATRHIVWTSAMAALIALPLLSLSLPPLRVQSAAFDLLQPGITFSVDTVSRASVPGSHAPSAPSSKPDLRAWIALICALGTAAMLASMLVAFVRLLQVRRRCRALDAEQRVLEAPPGFMPMVVGLWKPAVMLPVESAAWDSERRRMVLLHERAHVERGDVATHLLGRVALSLYWWNPLAWMAWREFLKERERAADDAVLNAGAMPAEYAEHLLEVARSMQSAPASAVAMARRSQLEGRLLAILDSKLDRRSVGRLALVTAALAAVAIVAPFAAVQAQERANDHMKRGDEALLQNDRRGAAEHFTRAMISGDRNDIARATAWMGLLQEQEGNAYEAEIYYERALAIAAADSLEAAIALEFMANLRRNQGRTDDSHALAARAIAIRQDRLAKLADADDPRQISDARKLAAGISPPKLAFKKEPEYSAEARALRFQGTVVLEVIVGSDGLAHRVLVKRPAGLGLDERAYEAVKKWRFEPAVFDGTAIPVKAQIEVNFRLK